MVEVNTIPTPSAPLGPVPRTPVVPADYAAMGVVTGYSPPDPERLRFFIIGPPGDGKTCFVAGIPKTLILDFEGGAWGVPSPRAARVVITNGEAFETMIAKLEADGKEPNRPYRRVVFDTIDQYVEMMNPFIAPDYSTPSHKCTDMTEYGTKGAGWAKLKNRCWSYIHRLEVAGYSWCIMGHITEKTITINNKDRTVIRPVLYDSFSKHVSRNSDYFMTVHSRRVSKPTFKEINGVKYPLGSTETCEYVIEASAVGSLLGTAQSKQRGVPTMPGEIVLPDLFNQTNGWDTFCNAYRKSVEEVKRKTASNHATGVVPVREGS